MVNEAGQEAREMGGRLEDRIPVQPTPTPDVTDALVEANAAYQTGDFPRAIERYYQVLDGAPNDLESHYRLALLLTITSDLGANEAQLEAADLVADRAINAAPESPDGWAIKAMVQVWSDNYGAAIAYAQRALEIDPNYVQANAILAEAYWQIDRAEQAQTEIDEAVEYLRTVGAAAPETISTVFRTQGFIAERQLERETAIAAYEQARSAAPFHTYISLELALSYFGNGQTDEAIELLNSALDSNPRDSSLLFQLGVIYVNIGDGEQATQIFTRCIEVDPQAASCYSWLGGLQYFAGSYPQAIQNLETAIEFGSTDPDDWWQLGRAHFNMLRCDLAIPVLREGYARVEGNNEQEEKFATGLRECGVEAVEAPLGGNPSGATSNVDPIPTPQ